MPSSPIKQLVVLRRRAGQRIKQFHDYHYQIHGRLSAAAPEETPSKYFQTHYFDSVYSNSTPAQPPWSGHNDATELYFNDMQHLGKTFGSAHVREVVGPDGQNFNDGVATIAMFTFEELISGGSEPIDQGDEQVIVASWFVQAREPQKTPKEIAAELHPLVVDAFGDLGGKIVANVALPDEADMLKYFTGETAPVYSACYQVYLTDKTQVAEFLERMARLEGRTAELVVKETTFATFGVRSVVFDQSRGVEFDPSRQPRLP